MFEKDIELARLLVQNLSELEASGKEIAAALRSAQAELDELKRVREEREQYLDVLSRAAALLKREDLKVDSPETSEIETRLAGLESQMAAINQEAAEYRQLVGDLQKRAPRLLSAATGEAPAAHADDGGADGPAALAEVGPDEAAAGADELADDEDEEEEEEVAAEAVEEKEGEPSFSSGGAFEAEQPAVNPTPPVPDEGEDEAAAGPARANGAYEMDAATEGILRRFNIPNLKRKEAYDHGRGAAYIIDATSVMERVPAYDSEGRGISKDEVRDELIRDFDLLGRELTGTFHLVFDSWFQPAVFFGNNVIPEFGSGEMQGAKPAGDRRLRELTFDMSAKLRPVCVVTGDSELADSLSGQGIHIIALGEFFKT